jgi:hypothetical protein
MCVALRILACALLFAVMVIALPVYAQDRLPLDCHTLVTQALCVNMTCNIFASWGRLLT